MPTPSHDAIAQLAYQLWTEAGQPEGRNEEFWYKAEESLRAATTPASGAPSAMRPVDPERLKAEAAAESVADNHLSPAPSQQAAIEAAIPNSGPKPSNLPPVSPPPGKVVAKKKR